jgi:hypothetical protein
MFLKDFYNSYLKLLTITRHTFFVNIRSLNFEKIRNFYKNL